MSCHNNTSYIHFQLRNHFIRWLKITIINIKVRCHRDKARKFLVTTLITCYLILELSTIQIYHWPSFVESDGCDGRLHCETRFKKCGIDFTDNVISRVRYINIHSNKPTIVLFKTSWKICIKLLYWKSPGENWQSRFSKVGYTNTYLEISIMGENQEVVGSNKCARDIHDSSLPGIPWNRKNK